MGAEDRRLMLRIVALLMGVVNGIATAWFAVTVNGELAVGFAMATATGLVWKASVTD